VQEALEALDLGEALEQGAAILWVEVGAITLPSIWSCSQPRSS